MDFENVYKSRSIIYKLLRLRGYDTKNYDQQTKEELNILYQNHSKKINYEMDSLDILIEGPSNKILVKYVLSEKLRGKNVEKQLDTQYEGLLEDNDTCIIITKDLVNYKGTLEEYVNRVFLTKKRYVQVLWLNRLLFDITQHELTPNYRILSEEEKKGVLDRFHLTEHNMPNVLVTDPLACFYGVKAGEVVEITKPSETNGYNTDYRLCIN
jgi:DNA-directed RNA polymerase subunit H (RpoH/RPB5)